ncbi:hypothetical protein [Paracoccus saliphilus]|uniref:Uncharacterized protein n=1 Tax=Paracoccus saliphilus TaxID=405559 RepID=A0AA45W2R5_9RHOB|nr:hypothetical protein [Paracoccus saliphilus]WCR01386.1 hypothetical protein JHX88_10515 [Paracoccus saliphilus]SIS70166.1 hypothetical protein SAMN05421772_10398 [Paracoccus saliphilus]
MDVLIVLVFVFVVAPFALLMWMPGWKSFTVAAVILLGLVTWFCFEAATTPPNYQPGAAFVDWLVAAFTIAVIVGIGIKATLLWIRRGTRTMRTGVGDDNG